MIFFFLALSHLFADDLAVKKDFCKRVDREIKRYRWKLDSCDPKQWIIKSKSVHDDPLVYATFGNPESKNKTLILSMVHPDEITPLYMSFALARFLKENVKNKKDAFVIFAPLVNPDGLFRRRPTRTNARGVDVNRNFPTSDWKKNALKYWKKKYRSSPRRYPGKTANSEPETQFQMDLIQSFKPKKIISIHAPLNFMDYDGPTVLSLKHLPREYVKRCLQLRTDVSASSGGFFPGSLGNYSGNEMGIPTLTLELPSARAKDAAKYWDRFRSGIKKVIDFKVPHYPEVTNSQKKAKK